MAEQPPDAPPKPRLDGQTPPTRGRQEALRASLRSNLRRRKDQARARAGTELETPAPDPKDRGPSP